MSKGPKKRALDVVAEVLFISGLILLSLGLNSEPSGVPLLVVGFPLLLVGFGAGVGVSLARRSQGTPSSRNSTPSHF